MTEQPSSIPLRSLFADLDVEWEIHADHHDAFGRRDLADDSFLVPLPIKRFLKAARALADSATGPLDVDKLARAIETATPYFIPGEDNITADQKKASYRYNAEKIAAEYAHLASQSSGTGDSG